MPEPELTQTEADALIAMEKICTDNMAHDFPMGGEKIAIELTSIDNREVFILNVRRGRIDLEQCTYQTRARKVIPLVRLDLGGPTHTNPDGEEVPTPHIHVYREEYGDKWAFPIPHNDKFVDTTDLWQVLQEFYTFCNITQPPNVSKGLFA